MMFGPWLGVLADGCGANSWVPWPASVSCGTGAARLDPGLFSFTFAPPSGADAGTVGLLLSRLGVFQARLLWGADATLPPGVDALYNRTAAPMYRVNIFEPHNPPDPRSGGQPVGDSLDYVIAISLPSWALTAQASLASSMGLNATDSAGHSLSDESYSLGLDIGGGQLSAQTIWGVFRALETLAQTVQFLDYQALGAAAPHYGWYMLDLPLQIDDAPRFAWRGVMLDTARHWFPRDEIVRLIDGMAAVKLNVFHWHATDGDSFPFNLSAALLNRSTFDPKAFYSDEDVAFVIEFARQRGIRVMPEIEGPGHAAAIGEAYPNATTQCDVWASNPPMSARANTFEWPQENLVGFDVTSPYAHRLASFLLRAMLSRFPDPYAHVGGDEVRTDCYENSPAMVAWMRANQCDGQPCATQTNGTWTYNWYSLVRPFQAALARVAEDRGKTAVVWEEAFNTNGVGTEAIVMSYFRGSLAIPGSSPTSPQELVNKGARVIVTNGFGMDRMNPLCANRFAPGCPTPSLYAETAYMMYTNDPVTSYLDPPIDPNQAALILGGEITLWGETLSPSNIDSRMWERGLAPAERLWSPAAINDFPDWIRRADRIACLLSVTRGIAATSVRPSYCDLPPRALSASQTATAILPPSQILAAPSSSGVPTATVAAVGVAAFVAGSLIGILVAVLLLRRNSGDRLFGGDSPPPSPGPCCARSARCVATCCSRSYSCTFDRDNVGQHRHLPLPAAIPLSS
jgi:hypothetical protein